MVEYITHSQIQIDRDLYDFINDNAIVGSDIDVEAFWTGFSQIINDLAPVNRQLIERREELQKLLDDWHRANRDGGINYDEYKSYLTEIGYLVKEGDDFTISTDHVDAEISTLAGPQLVVPITNARFALNAANARWGSLYDALYGTDAIASTDGAQVTAEYNPVRGQRVIEWAKDFLNQSAPLADCHYADAQSFRVDDGKLIVTYPGGETFLVDQAQFAGFRGNPDDPELILLKNNGLHIEIIFDPSHPIAKTDQAGIADVILESALTTIMDCEDSVATVDAEDKILAYSNWLGLMRTDIIEKFDKNGTTITRKLNADREYSKPDGSVLQLPGRAVMLIRNVGHLMTNPAILDGSGNEVPEGIMDCVISSLIALNDIGKNGLRRNSPAGSMYIVKPKMHGAEEVAFANTLFERTEQLLKLPANTIKMGIMDEERRTTVNLKECIRAAESRVVFINTGFLDRTGDEIHTSMQAGPMLRKGDMKQSTWINAYEDWNVDIGLQCGLSGKAQIGKGMWAMPDLMHDMLEQKINHPKSGANTAWVPSPTAATLHATHYHQIDVHEVQQQIAKRKKADIDDILTIPVSSKPNWTQEDIQFEIDNCTQTILGYVVRWIDQGIGCSKVPDIHDVGLMEDRATLRISSQFLANWIVHDICSKDQVLDTLKRMAKVVDQQNAGDSNYSNMAPDFENSVAFSAACDLIFKGVDQPSGYTEPILHQKRLEKKSSAR
jgi:malate synthase